MSDWQTIRRQILEELDRPNDSTYVDRALVEALRFHRSDSFWWNEDRWQVLTSANQYLYDLPPGFVRNIGKVFYLRGGQVTARRALTDRTNDWVEQFRYLGTDPDRWGTWEAGVSTGPPGAYAFYNNQIVLAPIPDTDGEVIEGRYIRDFGIPTVLYDGSAWQLYAPFSDATALPATFTTPWLTDGQELIRTRALYYLYKRYYRDQDNAQQALMDWLEAKTRMTTERVRRRGARAMRASL